MVTLVHCTSLVKGIADALYVMIVYWQSGSWKMLMGDEGHPMWDLGARRRIKCKSCKTIASRKFLHCKCGKIRIKLDPPHLVVFGKLGDWEVDKV